MNLKKGSLRGCITVLIAAALQTSTASAAPCAGFADVDDSSPFCPSVAWIKNRNVTTGCSIPGSYCPGDGVSRLAMAAFMQRLGVALIPEMVSSNQTQLNVNLDNGAYICATSQSSPKGFDRVATVTATIDFQLTSTGFINVDPVFTFDGGATWTYANPIPHAVFTNPANGGNGAVISAGILVPPSAAIATALFVVRNIGSTANLGGVSCINRTEVRSAF